MASHELGPAYFKNKMEQTRIKIALTDAIPPLCEYRNLIAALTEMLTTYQTAYFHHQLHNWFPGDVETEGVKRE